jgi:RND family efflux transporter MFP subunit
MLNVPQTAAPRIRPGMPTRIFAREAMDSAITGTVARTAGAFDPTTRTLLTEVHIPNRQRTLLPGMYARVQFSVPSSGASLRIPAIALIVRGEGTMVARVQNDTVRLVPVTLGRDFGTTVEVLDAVTAGEALVVNPPESLSDGLRVRAVARGGKPASPQ